MPLTVSGDLFSAFLACKYKAHLLQTPVVPELLRSSEHQDAGYRATAKQNLLASLPIDDRPPIPSSVSDLRLGRPMLFDVEMEGDGCRSVAQRLKRIPGESRLGDFHYEPMLFCRAGRLGKSHKLLLAFDGLVLGALQGRAPDHGVLVHGPTLHKSNVRLSRQMPFVLKLLQHLRDQMARGAAPVLVLNAHCNSCMFGDRCMEAARANDSLSLLQGVTEKEIARCKRKGIFTLTQLSYTFRPTTAAEMGRGCASPPQLRPASVGSAQKQGVRQRQSTPPHGGHANLFRCRGRARPGFLLPDRRPNRRRGRAGDSLLLGGRSARAGVHARPVHPARESLPRIRSLSLRELRHSRIETPEAPPPVRYFACSLRKSRRGP